MRRVRLLALVLTAALGLAVVASAQQTRIDGVWRQVGHLLFSPDNTYDIGASGATRPRNVFVAGAITAGGTIQNGSSGSGLTSGGVVTGNTASILWNGRTVLRSPADGVVTLLNNSETDFSRLQFGGTTSSFPALKRSGTALQARLADDSGYAPVAASGYAAGTDAGVTQTCSSGIDAITVTGGIITAITCTP